MITRLISFNKHALKKIDTLNLSKRFIERFSSSSQSLIWNMSEVKQANQFYQQKDMVHATQYFERSINILPFFQQGNHQYNEQFEDIVFKLAHCYTWNGKTSKIVQLTNNVLKQSKKVDKKLGKSMKNVIDAMSIIGKNQNQLQSDGKKLIKGHFLKIASNEQMKKLLPKQLIKLHKDHQSNITNLQPYMYGELRSSLAYVFTSLLLYPTFPSNPQYNKLCNTLLKNAQKSSQKNVIKPLSILITNLLRNNQFLQAEGMIKYCLDKKRQNMKLNLLKSNQEYVLLNLLLAYTYEGVDRLTQSKQIIQQYNSLFNLQTYIVQHFLIDSI